jgi:hypothetical protein
MRELFPTSRVLEVVVIKIIKTLTVEVITGVIDIAPTSTIEKGSTRISITCITRIMGGEM